MFSQREYSPHKEQKELIEVAFHNLKLGGEMAYSTCSLYQRH